MSAVREIEAIPQELRAYRRRHGLNLRDTAALAGVSFNTLSRVERGQNYQVSAALKILRLLAQDAAGGAPQGLPSSESSNTSIYKQGAEE